MSLPKHTLVFKIINDLDFGAENCLFLITKKKKKKWGQLYRKNVTTGYA